MYNLVMIKKLIMLGSATAVLVPILAYIRNVDWAASSLPQALFPVFGLLAFMLLWLHSISGVLEDWLRERFDLDSFIHWTALIILVSMLLHVSIILMLAKFNIPMLLSGGWSIWLGLLGLILLLTYDIGKPLRKSGFFARNWNKILIISNVGFVLIFFHSLKIGSDLQTGFMRRLWMFYGVTAILALIYTYGYKIPFGRK